MWLLTVFRKSWWMKALLPKLVLVWITPTTYTASDKPLTLKFVNSGWHTLVMKQAVMIGAGVRTSAESWELSVCASPLSCVWQDAGEHLHETDALVWACSSQPNPRTLISSWDCKRGRRSHSIIASFSFSCPQGVSRPWEDWRDPLEEDIPPVILNTGKKSDWPVKLEMHTCEVWEEGVEAPEVI